MESHGIIKKEGITNTSTLMSLLANPNATQAKVVNKINI